MKNPPKEYFNPPVDLMAEFEAEMAAITYKSYDGHYAFNGPTYRAFGWRRGGGYVRSSEFAGAFGGALISVSPSEDGSALPEVFFHCKLTYFNPPLAYLY